MVDWFLAKFASKDDLKANLSRLNSARKILQGSLLLYALPWSQVMKMPILTPPPLEHYMVSTPLSSSTVWFRGIKKGNLSTNELIDNMMFLRPQKTERYKALKGFSIAHDVPSGVEFEYFGPGLFWENEPEVIKSKVVQGYAREMAKWLAFLEKVYAESQAPFIPNKQEGEKHASKDP